MTEYIAFHADPRATPPMPAHVRRRYYDKQGNRVTQFFAVCESAGLDNDAMVDRIATLLNADEQERYR